MPGLFQMYVSAFIKHLPLMMLVLVFSVPEARSAETLDELNQQLLEQIDLFKSSPSGSAQADEAREEFTRLLELARAKAQNGYAPNVYTFNTHVLQAIRAQSQGSWLTWIKGNPPLLEVQQGLSQLVLEPLSVESLQSLVEIQMGELIRAGRVGPSQVPSMVRLITHSSQARAALIRIFYYKSNALCTDLIGSSLPLRPVVPVPAPAPPYAARPGQLIDLNPELIRQVHP